MGRRIVLTTFGSLGDLHPYIAVARGLKERGHSPVIATSPFYRSRIEAAGIELAAMGPSLDEFGDERELLEKASHPRSGSEFVVRQLVLPHIRRMYEELDETCRDADVLLSHPLTYAAPIVGEHRKLKWLGCALQPFVLFSIHDPSVPAQLPLVDRLRWLGPRFFRHFWQMPRRMSWPWVESIVALRKDLGLPEGRHPIFDGQFSPHGNLGLFSPHFAAPQDDWPRPFSTTGFVVYDRGEGGAGMSDELRSFLDAGAPPIVFTLGSSAVMAGAAFFRTAIEVAKKLRRRTLLIAGQDERNRPAEPLPDFIHMSDYAPYSEVFPRAAAVVHQGGIGTMAQAMRAGVPQLIVPFAHDQPDNASRIRRLGIGRSLHIGKFAMPRAAGEVRWLLEYPRYAERARLMGELIRREDGVAAACTAIAG